MMISRTRLLALLLVAALGIAAVGTASIATASSGSAAKAKKCKKGYKKVGKKCKKKKKISAGAPAPETVVTGANLVLVRQVAATKVQIKGTLTFSKATAAGSVPAVVNITTANEGNRAANVIIKVTGGDTTAAFSEISQVPAFHNGGNAAMTVVGITTNTVPVK